MFVVSPEGGFSGHVPDIKAEAVVPLVDGDARTVVSVPSTGIEGLPARLTVGNFDVGAWAPQGDLC